MDARTTVLTNLHVLQDIVDYQTRQWSTPAPRPHRGAAPQPAAHTWQALLHDIDAATAALADLHALATRHTTTDPPAGEP